MDDDKLIAKFNSEHNTEFTTTAEIEAFLHDSEYMGLWIKDKKSKVVLKKS